MATKKKPAKKAAKKKASAKKSTGLPGKHVMSQPDQKGRLVHMQEVGANQYQVHKPRTGFASETVDANKAQEIYKYQRINPHHK